MMIEIKEGRRKGLPKRPGGIVSEETWTVLPVL